MKFSEVLLSKEHMERPFSHQMPNGKILCTTEKKMQIIALSVLVGIFTLGIGGVLLFYSLAAKYKVEQIKKFELASQKTKRSPLSNMLMGEICAYLPAPDLSRLARVNKRLGAIANKKLIMREVNQLNWNLGLNEAHLDIQSANKYLTKLFTAVKLLGKNYTLPSGVCVYCNTSSWIPFFFKEVNARKTAGNLHFLTKLQLNGLLLDASGRGHTGIVKLLIQYHADINAATQSNKGVLHFAVLSGRLSVVQYLLKRGANPNKADNIRETPLHRAAYKGYFAMVKLLLQYRANINAVSQKGCTPLHYAVLSGRLRVVNHLLQQGANPNQLTNDNNTPLHYAAYHGRYEIAALLLWHHADVTRVNNRGQTPLSRVSGLSRDNNLAELLRVNAEIRSIA